MTKEQHKLYDKETTFCEACEQKLPSSHFSYSHIRINGTATRCKTCDWIHRHGGLPKVNGYSDVVIRDILETLIYNERTCVNSIADKYNISVNDVIHIINTLKVGNKNVYVLSKCAFCGKETESAISVFLSRKNAYCSPECYWAHKPQTVGHGAENACYNRIKTSCTQCGKEIFVIPFDHNQKNSFGDSHNFCSQDCYWKFRRSYYVGEKHPMHGVELSEERREQMRLTILQNSRSAKRLDSGIQLKINSILDELCIHYTREYQIKYYAVDNFLEKSGLIIEVMGDYWHASPLKYSDSHHMINQIQQRTIKCDKQKLSYIRNHLNVEILYLWESDINERPELCKELIRQYIDSQGCIENFHSFNWQYINGVLKLKDVLITPYQEMPIEKYRHLFVKKVG